MRNAIVLIHGFSSLRGEERLRLLIEVMHEEFPETKIIVPEYLEGYGTPEVLWAGRKSISEYAKVCRNIIEKEISGETLILIAYSMGCPIARFLVERMGIQAQAVLLIAAPNKGIQLSWWEKFLLKLIKRPCIEDMLPHSKFLRILNKEYAKRPPSARYYLIAGKKDRRVSLDSATGIESQETIVIPAGHSELIPRKYTVKINAIWDIIKILKKELET